MVMGIPLLKSTIGRMQLSILCMIVMTVLMWMIYGFERVGTGIEMGSAGGGRGNASTETLSSGANAGAASAKEREKDGRVKIHPNDKATLIAHGCFVDPEQLFHPPSPSLSPVSPLFSQTASLPDTDNDAWLRIDSLCNSSGNNAKPGVSARCPIPNAFHAVFGNKMPFKYHHYISLKSVHDIVRPFNMYIHGFDFPLDDALFRKAVADFNLIMVPTRNVLKVLGVDVVLAEHASDMLRMETVLMYGGVYADLDVFFLKPLHNITTSMNNVQVPPIPSESFLTSYETVLGEEEDWKFGNGIIFAKRCARFMMDWYKQYLQFNNQNWGFHSLEIPQKLWYQIYKGSSQESAFYLDNDRLEKPNWPSKELIHSADKIGMWPFSKNYAVHLWFRGYKEARTAEHPDGWVFDEKWLKENDDPLTRMGRYIMWGDKSKAFDQDNAYNVLD